MKKSKSHAFGKDVYLLGKDQHGDLIWLESASWDCGWYWGFGYIEVYTNQKNPSTSRDIQSHSHFDGLIWKKESGEYTHHVNQVMEDSVLTDTESWKLSDLMKTFYTLKETAEVLSRGYSHLTANAKVEKCIDKKMVKKINEVMLPAIFDEIYSILTP